MEHPHCRWPKKGTQLVKYPFYSASRHKKPAMKRVPIAGIESVCLPVNPYSIFTTHGQEGKEPQITTN